MFDTLKEKIKKKEITIGVIGLGYVGLPLVMEFAFSGIKVIGFDIDKKKILKLNKSKTYISHIPNEKIERLISSNLFEPTCKFDKLSQADAILICVPTPLSKYRDPDLSYVLETTEEITKHLRPGQVIVLESTTYPGTTEEKLLPILKKSGLIVDKDFFLAFSPEREDPGRKNFTTKNIPKVVGGVTERSTILARDIYFLALEKVVPVSSTAIAEATKILENTYRAVNIALVNELKIVFDKMNINIWEVIEAASTKPFGYTPFYPGPGLGGHCIPIDPFYLTWKSKEFETPTRFIELAGEINTSMPDFVIRKVQDILNINKKCINSSKILIIGVTYKPDIDDMRESPALKIIKLLNEKNALVDYYDPFIPEFPDFREWDFDMKSIELNPENIKKYDLVLILTNHSEIDYKELVENSKLIIDTRNATKEIKTREKIFFA